MDRLTQLRPPVAATPVPAVLHPPRQHQSPIEVLGLLVAGTVFFSLTGGREGESTQVERRSIQHLLSTTCYVYGRLGYPSLRCEGQDRPTSST